MRSSLISWMVCGSAAVSALAFPRSLQHRADLVDLDDLAKLGMSFDTITLDEAKSMANSSSSSTSNAASSSSTTDHEAVGTSAEEPDSSVKATAAGSCTSPATRIEWRKLSGDQQAAFLQAIKCLMGLPASGAFASQGSQNRYEDLVAVHYAMTGTIHGVAQFLPWHRYYLSVFESLLREECSYTGPMTWWDERIDAGKFVSAPVFTSGAFGTAAAKTANNQGTCVSNGDFGGMTVHVGGDRCLSRAIDDSITGNTGNDFVNTCNSNANYNDMEKCTELGPHAYGHNGVGAVMSIVNNSPDDPIFFMHHGFVDHNYVAWQNADIPNRLTQINGCADTNNPCAQISSSYVLSSQGLRPDKTIADVFDTQGGYLCYVYDYY